MPHRAGEIYLADPLWKFGPIVEDKIRISLFQRGNIADSTRMAFEGWSYGGYMTMWTVTHSQRFKAAVAGAPVTDWEDYDTHYTERYLGNPSANAAPYDRTSLIVDADRLGRPLMLVHGLADDNVVAAHTLQFSSALLAAGKPHEVLPLSGVSHMTPQEVVAESLLLLQLEFLRRHLRA